MIENFETLSREHCRRGRSATRADLRCSPASTQYARPTRPPLTPVFEVRNANVYYGAKQALADVTTNLNRNIVTALIGPSGCGKSTFLRSLNRMNDSVKGFRIDGDVLYHGNDLYHPSANRIEVRGASAWSSRSRTRSPSRSTTTSPGARATSG